MKKLGLIVVLLGAAAGIDWALHGRRDVAGQTDFASLSPARVENLIGGDVLRSLQLLREHVDDERAFSAESCSGDIEAARAIALRLEPERMDYARIKAGFREIIESSFRLRRALARRLSGFSRDGLVKDGHPCVSSMRSAMRTLRYVEDYLLLTVLNPRPFDEAKDPVSGPILNDEKPKLVTMTGAPVKLRSGDVLMSRGNAATSAAISRIGTDEAQFSHLAQIYIDAPPGTEIDVATAAKDPRVHTIEAHIEVGSFTRSFGKYLGDGNGRVAQMRPKLAPEKAHAAAKRVFDQVREFQARKMREAGRRKLSVNDNPPYDFQMDGRDHEEIFCAEIVSIAFEQVGLRLPVFPTTLRKNDLTERMAISVEKAFAPADLDIDPSFEMLAEWRDVRKLESLLRKDAILSSMFKWMDELNYRLRDSPVSYAKALIGWTARQLDLGFSEALPKNMPRSVIRMTFTLDKVVGPLERQLAAVQAARVKEGARYRLTDPAMGEALERIRAEDEKRSQRFPGGSLFHLSFSR